MIEEKAMTVQPFVPAAKPLNSVLLQVTFATLDDIRREFPEKLHTFGEKRRVSCTGSIRKIYAVSLSSLF